MIRCDFPRKIKWKSKQIIDRLINLKINIRQSLFSSHFFELDVIKMLNAYLLNNFCLFLSRVIPNEGEITS